ncbi:MAG: gfo/Idh/MocA family oxidoreductase, partial [Clostridia bacterium]|nr:gfo/Idh/MocA family oxidoreductase [Clostridia bacterium]
YTQAVGSEQAWSRLVVGNKPQFATATGSIFEFGFTDAILQMWAAFVYEIAGKEIEFGCCTPEETILSHKLHTAALLSEKEKTVVSL